MPKHDSFRKGIEMKGLSQIKDIIGIFVGDAFHLCDRQIVLLSKWLKPHAIDKPVLHDTAVSFGMYILINQFGDLTVGVNHLLFLTRILRGLPSLCVLAFLRLLTRIRAICYLSIVTNVISVSIACSQINNGRFRTVIILVP